MTYPKLRPVQAHLIEHEGQPYILLKDPLELLPDSVAIPRAAGPLLVLCDGNRDIPSLKADFELTTGMALDLAAVEQIMAHLDEAFLLENERFYLARQAICKQFREAPFRPPALAGGGYPANPATLSQMLDQYINATPETTAPQSIKGIISPHIDFMRGGPVYAQVWGKAAKAISDVELVVILGTDHQGGRNLFTLTRQNYATPWGNLPTDVDLVEKMIQAIDPQNAFEDELHHKNEHSIELALIWLHYILKESTPQIVPILTGSFDRFIRDDSDPENDRQISAMVDIIREESKSRRTLVVAAADLAHMGPAFGDNFPMGTYQKTEVTAADAKLIKAMCVADAGDFFSQIKNEGDCRRICGMVPIYLTLRVLDQSRGTPSGYALCPADETDSSLVSICGMTLS